MWKKQQQQQQQEKNKKKTKTKNKKHINYLLYRESVIDNWF